MKGWGPTFAIVVSMVVIMYAAGIDIFHPNRWLMEQHGMTRSYYLGMYYRDSADKYHGAWEDSFRKYTDSFNYYYFHWDRYDPKFKK